MHNPLALTSERQNLCTEGICHQPCDSHPVLVHVIWCPSCTVKSQGIHTELCHRSEGGRLTLAVWSTPDKARPTLSTEQCSRADMISGTQLTYLRLGVSLGAVYTLLVLRIREKTGYSILFLQVNRCRYVIQTRDNSRFQ